MEGHLMKKSPKPILGRHVWQKRYFVLTVGALAYYKKKSDVSSDKVVGILTGEHMQKVKKMTSQTKAKRYRFNIFLSADVTDRIFELFIDDHKVGEQWVQQITQSMSKKVRKSISQDRENIPVTDDTDLSDVAGKKFWKAKVHKEIQQKKARRQGVHGEKMSIFAKHSESAKSLADLSLTPSMVNPERRISSHRDKMYSPKSERSKSGMQTETQIQIMTESIKDALNFGQLSLEPKERQYIINRFWKKAIPSGTKVRSAGDHCALFYYIEEGSFEQVERNHKTGETIKIEYKANDCFGELSLLQDEIAKETVTSLEDSVCWLLDRQTYRNFTVRQAERRYQTYETFLKSTKLLGKILEPTAFPKLAEAMELREFKKGENVVVQGETADKFYILKSGECEVIKDSIQVNLYECVGDYFGERALLTDSVRAATVTVSSDTAQVLQLSKDDFELLLGKQEEIREVMWERVKSYGAVLSSPMTVPRELLKGQTDEKKDIEVDPSKVKNTVTSSSKVLRESITKQDTTEQDTTEQDTVEQDTIEQDTTLNSTDDGKDPGSTKVSISEPVNKGPPKPVERKIPAFQPNDYKVIGTLGRGSFGLVQLVLDESTGETYALKGISKAMLVEHNQVGFVINERKTMAMVEHPFIVRLHGAASDQNFVYFLLEPSLGGELFCLLNEQQRMTVEQAQFYAGSVVLVFEYLHSLNIIYRDLKPENLLLDKRGYLKVTDFGFAKQITGRTYTFCGTPDYVAPEIVRSQGHGCGVDWWCTGILIYEMLSGQTPFYDERGPNAMYKRILADRPLHFPSYFDDASKDILQGLLQKKPTRRLGVIIGGATLIKEHEWFKDFDFDALYKGQLKAPFIKPIKNNMDISNFDDEELDGGGPYDDDYEEYDAQGGQSWDDFG